MAYVLRKAMLGKWEHDQSGKLTEDGLRYALKELQLQDSRLSVYLVDDDKSNVNRIIAALAATRISPGIMGFFLLNVEGLDRLDIGWKKIPMDTTPDDTVNCVHVDLEIPDESKLRELAQSLRTTAETGEIPEIQVAQMIKRGIEKGEIDCSKVKIDPGSRFWKLFDDCNNVC